jgi:hypothetical protein
MRSAAIHHTERQIPIAQARLVADPFHVIRTVNQHLLGCWKELDPMCFLAANR